MPTPIGTGKDFRYLFSFAEGKGMLFPARRLCPLYFSAPAGGPPRKGFPESVRIRNGDLLTGAENEAIFP